jgi:RimJ/RimL family protein N-acetyltransferase
MTTPSPCGRRARQLRQIAALVAAGADLRATGLALEHLACFPQDAAALVEAGAITDQTDPIEAAGTPAASPLDGVAWPRTTARLSIRRAADEDIDRIWRFRQLEAVSRWLTRAPSTLEDLRSQLTEPGSLEKTLMIEREGEVIGDLMLAVDDAWAQAEVAEQARDVQARLGWAIDPAVGGQGYATEAVHELLRICFEDLGLRRVVAECFAANESSWRLMERVGMRREAHNVRDSLHRSGEWLDGFAYALLREEWLGP